MILKVVCTYIHSSEGYPLGEYASGDWRQLVIGFEDTRQKSLRERDSGESER